LVIVPSENRSFILFENSLWAELHG
jgi:hypothetical protein